MLNIIQIHKKSTLSCSAEQNIFCLPLKIYVCISNTVVQDAHVDVLVVLWCFFVRLTRRISTRYV